MSDLSSRVSREALLKSLEKLTGRKDVELLDYQVNRASTAVEGFASLVLRVRVSYRLPGDDKINSQVFVVKSMPQTEYQREFVKSIGIFPREWLFYSKAMPLIERASSGRVEVPLPKCYYGVCGDDDSAFYMEDLVASGYRSVHRSHLTVGLDYAHCSLVMKKMGSLHALATAAEKTLDPGSGGWVGSFPEFDRESAYYIPGPDDPPAPAEKMIESLLQNFRELCSKIDGFPKMAVASGALDRVLPGVYPTIFRLKQTPPLGRRILTHGDCWMNNMMFRYRKGENEADEPTDMKFFDLQLAKCCHPSTDLLYFMYTSTRKPVREKYFNTLIEEYYESLAETLKVLDGGPPPFSLEDFKSDLMKVYKPYGIIMGTLYSPLEMLGDDFLLPNAQDLTNDKMKEFFDTGSKDKVKYRFDNDPKYRSYIEDIVEDFLEMAFPDGLKSVESSPLLVRVVS